MHVIAEFNFQSYKPFGKFKTVWFRSNSKAFFVFILLTSIY